MFIVPRIAGAAIALFLAGCMIVSPRQLQNMQMAELVEAFRPCASPTGVTGEIARLRLGQAPDVSRMEYAALSNAGMVADGYNHGLFFDRRNGVAYLAETGGYAGVHRWYGPLTPHVQCAGRAPPG
jgi:hypothetical protein